jgi:hypothetical protein
MRLSLKFLASLIGLWVISYPLSAAPTSQSQVEGSHVNEQKDVRPLFFQRLQTMADTGDLFDPSSVSKILGIDLRVTSSESVPQPPDCSEIWKPRSEVTTSATIDASSWYRVESSGSGNLDVPAAFINPATKTSDAKLSYAIKRRIQCTDQFRLQDHTSAQISFSGLPSYACVTANDIEHFLPKATPQLATDGVSFYHYQGRLDDEAGTDVSFVFRLGVSCALAVTVTQDQEAGLRYLRANSKRRNCEIQPEREFCSTHAAFGWSDGATQDEMRQYADKVCGTVDSLVKTDTERGTQPAPLPKRKLAAEPCQVHDD